MTTHPISTGVPKLTRFERQVLDFIMSRTDVTRDFCLATETIADKLAVKPRYVQCALKRLCDAGKIEREWDYTLEARRRFRLGKGVVR
jgi:DNA-binding MarR family transcriptional regulator